MRDIAVVAVVAMVALVGLAMIGDGGASGAFVSRPALRILQPIATPSADALCNIDGFCGTPNCPTGLVRVQLYEEDIPRYQYVVVPQNILGSDLGACCGPGTSFTFSATQDGESRSLNLQCSGGAWKAFLN